MWITRSSKHNTRSNEDSKCFSKWSNDSLVDATYLLWTQSQRMINRNDVNWFWNSNQIKSQGVEFLWEQKQRRDSLGSICHLVEFVNILFEFLLYLKIFIDMNLNLGNWSMVLCVHELPRAISRGVAPYSHRKAYPHRTYHTYWGLLEASKEFLSLLQIFGGV